MSDESGRWKHVGRVCTSMSVEFLQACWVGPVFSLVDIVVLDKDLCLQSKHICNIKLWSMIKGLRHVDWSMSLE